MQKSSSKSSLSRTPLTVEDIIPAIDSFIETSVGAVVQVFHEIQSDELHIDVHHGRSREDVRYNWLFTSGMSRIPMRVPPSSDAVPYAELMLCLPPDWPLDMNSLQDPCNHWPIRILKALARYPLKNKSWLYGGHSVPFGQPFASNTKMSSVMIMRPSLLLADPVVFVGMERVLLWAVIPAYQSEVEFKVREGSPSLGRKFADRGVTELLDPRRDPVV